MADYAKFTCRGIYSRNSDYSDPEQDTHTAQYSLTPSECLHQIIAVPTTPGQDVVAASAMTNITALLVINNSSTAAEFITVTGQEAAGTAVTIKVPAGGFVHLPGMDPDTAINLMADSGTPDCEVFLVGA